MRPIRVLIVCAALAMMALALPTGAHAGQLPSCGTWGTVPNGRIAIDVGDPFNYTIQWDPNAAPDARLDSFEVFWGDGTSSRNSGPLFPGPGAPLPADGSPKSYSAPGSYNLTLSTSGQITAGAPCADFNYPLGIIDVLSRCGTPSPCPPPPPPCSACVATPRAATSRCRKALGTFLRRKFPRATGKVVTCRKAKKKKFPCTVKWHNPACGCNYKAKATVTARGKVRFFGVKRVR
jgi:hypothetical protein